MSQRELGWVAGILEGEGCFSAYKNKWKEKTYLHAKIEVQSADRDVIDRIYEYTKLGTIGGPYKTRSAKHSPMHSWRVQGDDAKTLMRVVFDLMGKRRQEKIKLVLDTTR